MKYTLNHADNIFIVKTSGNGELGTFIDFIDELFAHTHWKPGSRILVDHTDLNSAQLTVGDMTRLADICAKRMAIFGKAQIAFLVSRDLEFGMLRMWGTLIDGKWDAIVHIFRSRDEAMAWLVRSPKADHSA